MKYFLGEEIASWEEALQIAQKYDFSEDDLLCSIAWLYPSGASKTREAALEALSIGAPFQKIVIVLLCDILAQFRLIAEMTIRYSR